MKENDRKKEEETNNSTEFEKKKKREKIEKKKARMKGKNQYHHKTVIALHLAEVENEVIVHQEGQCRTLDYIQYRKVHHNFIFRRHRKREREKEKEEIAKEGRGREGINKMVKKGGEGREEKEW